MQIIQKKINEIRPYEKNPRRNEEAVRYVAKSIEDFGFKVPIVIDKDGVIVAGHTRYKAAKKLNLDEVPCVVADDLSDEQVKAFRLADNKVSEKADWDFELLNMELDDLIDFDMSEFGFYAVDANDEFEHLFESQLEKKAPEAKEEPAEEAPEETGWKVIVRLDDEEDAVMLMQELTDEGYDCEVAR